MTIELAVGIAALAFGVGMLAGMALALWGEAPARRNVTPLLAAARDFIAWDRAEIEAESDGITDWEGFVRVRDAIHEAIKADSGDDLSAALRELADARDTALRAIVGPSGGGTR